MRLRNQAAGYSSHHQQTGGITLRARILLRSAGALLLASLVIGGVAGVALADPCPEPNDSVATACRLVPGTPVQGTLDTNADVDAYSIDVPAGATMVHVLLNNLPADYDLTLLGADGQSVLAQSATTGLDDEHVDQPLGPGRYYLFVTAFGAASPDRPYSLTLGIEAPPPATPTATADATATPPPTATPIPPSPTPATGFIAQVPLANELGDPVRPHAVAVGPQGNFYIADYDGNRIRIYAPDGMLLGRMGELAGDAPGKLRNPDGVAVDGQGAVYVADAGNHRVQAFSPDGVSIGIWGSAGSGDGGLLEPSAVALDDHGNLYVTDKSAHRVEKFGPDGRVLAIWGKRGGQPGEFEAPRGVALDGAGNVYVADTGNNRIQKLSSDGDVVAVWGSPNQVLAEPTDESGSQLQIQQAGHFDGPQGIVVDALGDVYVADYGNNRIQRFDTQGNPTGMWGEPGAEVGQLNHPSGLALDAQGALYVADRDNARLEKLIPPAPPTPTPIPTDTPAPAESPTPAG
jgi:sugar lactone lactonase YvrE